MKSSTHFGDLLTFLLAPPVGLVPYFVEIVMVLRGCILMMLLIPRPFLFCQHEVNICCFNWNIRTIPWRSMHLHRHPLSNEEAPKSPRIYSGGLGTLEVGGPHIDFIVSSTSTLFKQPIKAQHRLKTHFLYNFKRHRRYPTGQASIDPYKTPWSTWLDVV